MWECESVAQDMEELRSQVVISNEDETRCVLLPYRE